MEREPIRKTCFGVLTFFIKYSQKNIKGTVPLMFSWYSATFLVTSPIDINVPTRGLLAVGTKSSLSNKKNVCKQ